MKLPKTKEDTEDFLRSELKRIADERKVSVLPAKASFDAVKARLYKLKGGKPTTIIKKPIEKPPISKLQRP